MTKIFNQLEINKAALNHSNSLPFDNDLLAFMAGADFIETKIEGLSIEFAKYLFNLKICKAKSMNDIEEYSPHEFKLMLGELSIKSKELFETFIKEKNEKI